MEISKVSTKGQITIPVNIRKILDIKKGDSVIFIKDGDHIVIMNAEKIEDVLPVANHIEFQTHIK